MTAITPGINYGLLKDISDPAAKAFYDECRKKDSDGIVRGPKVNEQEDCILYIEETGLTHEEFKAERSYYDSILQNYMGSIVEDKSRRYSTQPDPELLSVVNGKYSEVMDLLGGESTGFSSKDLSKALSVWDGWIMDYIHDYDISFRYAHVDRRTRNTIGRFNPHERIVSIIDHRFSMDMYKFEANTFLNFSEKGRLIHHECLNNKIPYDAGDIHYQISRGYFNELPTIALPLAFEAMEAAIDKVYDLKQCQGGVVSHEIAHAVFMDDMFLSKGYSGPSRADLLANMVHRYNTDKGRAELVRDLFKVYRLATDIMENAGKKLDWEAMHNAVTLYSKINSGNIKGEVINQNLTICIMPDVSEALTDEVFIRGFDGHTDIATLQYFKLLIKKLAHLRTIDEVIGALKADFDIEKNGEAYVCTYKADPSYSMRVGSSGKGDHQYISINVGYYFYYSTVRKYMGWEGSLNETMEKLVNIHSLKQDSCAFQEVLAREVEALVSVYLGPDREGYYKLNERELLMFEKMEYKGKPMFKKAVEKYRLGMQMMEDGIGWGKVQDELQYATSYMYNGKQYSWPETKSNLQVQAPLLPSLDTIKRPF
ncbi:hypothetical protein ACFLZ2_01890 [Candidatus Margulisiibacteriota bacterium]